MKKNFYYTLFILQILIYGFLYCLLTVGITPASKGEGLILKGLIIGAFILSVTVTFILPLIRMEKRKRENEIRNKNMDFIYNSELNDSKNFLEQCEKIAQKKPKTIMEEMYESELVESRRILDEARKRKEAENLEFLASTLTYEHQESAKNELLRKAETIRESLKNK